MQQKRGCVWFLLLEFELYSYVLRKTWKEKQSSTWINNMDAYRPMNQLHISQRFQRKQHVKQPNPNHTFFQHSGNSIAHKLQFVSYDFRTLTQRQYSLDRESAMQILVVLVSEDLLWLWSWTLLVQCLVCQQLAVGCRVDQSEHIWRLQLENTSWQYLDPKDPLHRSRAKTPMPILLYSPKKLTASKKMCASKRCVIFELEILTYSRRVLPSFPQLKLEIFIPLIISNSTTPKAYMSDFSENIPVHAYSGDMYPLFIYHTVQPSKLT